jgi:hypothetical protein
MGNLLLVVVHAANIPDNIAGALMLKKLREKYPSIKGICGDAGYRGTFVLAATELGLTVDISEKLYSTIKNDRINPEKGDKYGYHRICANQLPKRPDGCPMGANKRVFSARSKQRTSQAVIGRRCTVPER